MAFLAVMALALAFQGCGSPASASLSKLTPVISMSKGPCYGRCPVFTLTVYDNGIASYKGEMHTERLGTYVRKLEKGEMEKLLSEFKRANLWQYRDTYRGHIPDMQSVSITYHENGRQKTVAGKEIRPNAVKWLETQLDQLALTDGWILKEPAAAQQPDHLIPNQLLVELQGGTDPEEWASGYTAYQMSYRRFLPDTDFAIFSFDDSLISPEEMLGQVRMDEAVLSAEFNKKIYEDLGEEAPKSEKPEAPDQKAAPSGKTGGSR